MTEPIVLKAGGSRAAISLAGAELAAWESAGRTLIWRRDPGTWDATAPLLFPVVGWTRNGEIRVDGEVFPMGVHGFARTRQFQIAGLSESHLRLADAADPVTLRSYPFGYALEIEFRLTENALVCEAFVSNRGDRPMPYAFGFHPGFAWPLGGSAAEHEIVFDENETLSVPVIAPGGLFSARQRPIPLADRRLALTGDLMAQEALCFLDTRSAGLVFRNGAGGELRVETENMPHIALWSRPPAPFLCIESWTGYGDPEDFRGDLREKPSMRLLAPGDSARHAVRYSFTCG